MRYTTPTLLMLLVTAVTTRAAVAIQRAETMYESLAKREAFSGRTTWYSTNLGADACTGRNHKDSDWFVAMNMAQRSECCGRKLRIGYNGKTTIADCVDFCATCPSVGQLDLTKGLFEFFTNDLNVGEFTSTWSFVAPDDDSNSAPLPPPSVCLQVMPAAVNGAANNTHALEQAAAGGMSATARPHNYAAVSSAIGAIWIR
ncbi:hypothetical protein MKEN_00546100 [Mycena kentingensis (nom. inval.)]|nr:hypothetical protein MKEN_00546100 [Mycena kentingensis (nom. inval.)]